MIAALALMVLLAVGAGIAQFIDRGPVARLISALLGETTTEGDR